MPPTLLVLLRLLHIVSGAVWVGAVAMTAFFLMPAVMSSGPAGGQVMGKVAARKLPQTMMALMALTLLSGIGMMWDLASRTDGAWFSSSMGRTISLGAAFAIVGAVYGMVVNRPVANRIAQLGAAIQAGGGPPTAEQAGQMQALQGKLLTASRVVAVLLLLAVAAMAVARYL
jgi:hypothetical protein